MRWLLLLVFACRPDAREPAAATPAEGLAIAIYANGARAYGVVDDRRTIEVAGDTVFLDRIDPAAALQSLVIEPLGADPIKLLACVRERLVPSPTVLSPVVRCRVRARAGKHFVRVLHITSTLTFTTQHDLTMTAADRAQLTTRFAIATPTWRAPATVTLFDGVPGDKTTPTQLARAPVILDGSTAIIARAPRDIPARLRSIYDGTKPDESADIKPSDIVWGRESRHQVWVWLELADPTLPRGPLRAHLALPDAPTRDLAIAADLRVQTTDHTRYPLFVDETLLGTRKRTVERADGISITDRLVLTVANLGTEPREVWVEERLRTAKRRTLAQSWPTRPTFAKDRARTKVTIAPGQTHRLGFTIDYEL